MPFIFLNADLEVIVIKWSNFGFFDIHVHSKENGGWPIGAWSSVGFFPLGVCDEGIFNGDKYLGENVVEVVGGVGILDVVCTVGDEG